MARLVITDPDGREVLRIDDARALGWRVPELVLSVARELVEWFGRPLTDLPRSRTIELDLRADVPVGPGERLTLQAGASLKIQVHRAGETVHSGHEALPGVTVANGSVLVSLGVDATANARAAASRGSRHAGFSAGTLVRVTYLHPFDIVGPPPTLAAALQVVMKAMLVPGSAQELAALPVGSCVSLAGEGTLTADADVPLATGVNTFATPGLPLVGAVALAASAALRVAASWRATGGFELRLTRPDAARAAIGVHRRGGRALEASARVSLSASATLADSELVSALLRALSREPEADLAALVAAGLSDGQIGAIQQAIAASLDRSLSLAAHVALSSHRQSEGVVAVEVDLDRMDPGSRTAVDAAVGGDLRDALRESAVGSGALRTVASATHALESRGARWRVNLLGVLNTGGLATFLREASLSWDPSSGALVAADRVTAQRLRVHVSTLAADPAAVREIVFASLVITAACQASRALGASLVLTATHTYVEQRARTRRRDLEDDFRVLMALGLCDAEDGNARARELGDGGASTFVVENELGSAACEALFLDAQGAARPTAFYERVARSALLALLPADDPDRAYRRFALERDGAWRRARALLPQIGPALEAETRRDPLKVAVVTGDVVTVAWWAAAMHEAARGMVAMRAFLGQRDAASLRDDPGFRDARRQLERALSRIAATSNARFGDPWDVLALDAASARLGHPRGVVVTTAGSARYDRVDRAESSAVARAVRGSVAAPLRAGKRPWTAGERGVFGRHVVNLRDGALSGSGGFTSTREQLSAIVGEHLRDYVRTQRALGERPRVVLYAHGGLVGEREGLALVLARQRFWALNGIYPVYFVWETGLRETLRDAIGAAVAGRRIARGAVLDEAIERLARPAGRALWRQMKQSAERACAPDGGARIFAEMLATAVPALGDEVELHAVGHSAGAVFLSHFVPALADVATRAGHGVALRTLSLLAPAVTTALFKRQLVPLTGNGNVVAQLAMFSMSEERELADASMRPYSKSLLYLVSESFEEQVPMPLLGLQASVRRDPALLRYFGVAGVGKMADAVFSVTDGHAPPRQRSTAATHGAFDNDVPTMTSVVRRVLDASDATQVVEYFEDPVA